METTTPTQEQDAGLVRRGLLLLGGMSALVIVVLLIILRPTEAPRTAADIAPRETVSAPGWEIRYNAAVALARRGSLQTPWPVILEMLDERQQLRNFRVKLRNGQEVADEEDARRTVENALLAVGQWHKKHTASEFATLPSDLEHVYAQVDRLAQEGNPSIRVQAERTRNALFRK